jgi:hypothetical protein
MEATMSCTETEAFQALRARHAPVFAARRAAFEEKLLEIEAERAAAAPVESVMSPGDFAAMMRDPFVLPGEGGEGDAADEADH